MTDAPLWMVVMGFAAEKDDRQYVVSANQGEIDALASVVQGAGHYFEATVVDIIDADELAVIIGAKLGP